MSKIEAGRITLHTSNFDLHRLLDNLEAMLQLRANSKGLQLLFNRSTTLPRYIKADEGKLNQVLINLLNNAIKFTQKGKVCLSINQLETTEQQADTPNGKPETLHLLHFQVEDTGPGIPAEDLDRIFDVFGQTEVGLSATEGTGLGLAISQKFLQLMGGEITVSSQVGHGSQFSFTVQVADADRIDPEQQISSHSRVIGLAPNQPTYRMLIADDDPTNRLLLVKFLSSLRIEVREARNGKEAIALWRDWHPHLIWMDMQMPVMDGNQATASIKTSPQGDTTIIIALTASAFEEQRQKILAAGCDDFVRKPFKKEELLEKMAEHLGVQYRYEDDNEKEIPSLVSHLPVKENPEILHLLTDSLTTMPVSWIQQVHCAATQGSDFLLLQLIGQIPANQSFLAEALAHLVENFRFDQIMELTYASTLACPRG
jgi:CheY-like chemotaxis protein